MEDRSSLVETRKSPVALAPRSNAQAEARVLPEPVGRDFIDRFDQTCRPGKAIGATVAAGTIRRGVDKEGVISVDHGALRIQPLVKPRWRRSGIAYGPYDRRNGLAFGAFILNGHNTSQTGPLPEGLRLRLRRWILGSETETPRVRLWRWLRSRTKKFLVRRLLHWAVSGSAYLQTSAVDENLAIGWFAKEVPNNPTQEGNAVVMHALGPECGELWTRSGTANLPTIRGLQNVPTYYVVVLRERGAAYYAASLPGVPGLGAYPTLTPVAIDAFGTEPTVYAGLHQSVLGQVGFRVDTRVYRTQVAQLPEYREWYGSASGADELTGAGSLDSAPAETGGRWTVWEGQFQRTAKGLVGSANVNGTCLDLPAPAGLVHVVMETADTPAEGWALLWRVKDHGNYWAFEVGPAGCTLCVVEDGRPSRSPSTLKHRLLPNALNSVQVRDDGRQVSLYLNGGLVYDTQFVDTRLHDGTGVGLRCVGDGSHVCLRSFEAHPRVVAVPQPLDLGIAWSPEATRIVIEDDFGGLAGDLAKRATPLGGAVWHRDVGKGEIRLSGEQSARVCGSVGQPCPGRTAYAVPWRNERFADASVVITPPGTKKGMGERGRGGLIFWQDSRNYITLSIFLDDWYGTSIAAFFYRDGYEELYDAVWSNIGTRVYWGKPYDFRVAFDGTQFTAFVNGEPVLYRALRDIYEDWDRLSINRVGLVSNWEWGSDTGTTFRRFVVKDRP